MFLRCRTVAEKLTEEHKAYVFDLDTMETGENDLNNAELYSVDAYYQGMSMGCHTP